jgi:hypothetical protein
MPSAIHKAPLIALHTALICFLENIPFDHEVVNANILSNIEASESLVPDMRISFQNMKSTTSETIIPGLAETTFSQHWNILFDKLEEAIKENLSLLFVIAAIVFKNVPYCLPKTGSDAGNR